MKKLGEILLIDDSRGTNSLNKRLLEEMEIAKKITTSLNGMHAIDYLMQINDEGEFPNPDLILLDINMPIMDGYQFLEKYTELKNHIQINHAIIMLSSSESEIDKEKSNKYKIVKGFQSKPLTKEKVMSTINTLFK